MIFNTWQFNLVLYYIGVVVFFQCYKLAVKNVVRDGAATIILQVVAGASILVLAPFFAFKVPDKSSLVLLLGAACIFYAINDRLQMTARKHLEVSTFSIIGQLTTVFLIIYGVVLFRNPLVGTKLLGAILIIAANVWLFYKPQKRLLKIDKYSFMAICAALAFATAVSIDIGISKQFNLPLYISVTLLLPALFIAIGSRVKPHEIMSELKKGSLKLFLLTGVVWGFTIFFSLRAFQLGTVSTIVPLEAATVILNVLAAYIFLKEHTHPVKKILAAVLVVVGVVLTVH